MMKKQREDEQVIDDGEERNGDGTKSDNPQKRDDKINRKREDEQVTVERSGDGMTSDDPQRRDDKIKRKREDEQVIDDDVERSSDGTKSDDPQKSDDKIKRKRKDDEEIISVMRTDLRMPEEPEAVCSSESDEFMAVRFAACSSASGDSSRALSADEAEYIISQTISSMTTTNSNSFHLKQPKQPSRYHSGRPLASGDRSRALNADEAEDIISQTISSMTATTTTPSTSNNPAGAIQAPAAPPPPPPRTAQASPLSKVASSITKCFKGAQ